MNKINLKKMQRIWDTLIYSNNMYQHNVPYVGIESISGSALIIDPRESGIIHGSDIEFVMKECKHVITWYMDHHGLNLVF